jgi:CheY-like chemotaxis protein
VKTSNPNEIMNTESTQRPVRVLIADDQESNLRVAERILERAGYVVRTSSSGADALGLDEREGPFDVYVLDVMMPGMRGTEVARSLKAKHPAPKILYYTAYDSVLFSDQRILPENEAFVQKPVSMRDLAEAVSLLVLGHTRGPNRAQARPAARER